MTELRRALDGVAAEAAAGTRLTGTVPAVTARVRRRRVARRVGAGATVLGVAGALTVGALALADREPLPPAVPTPACGETFALPATDAPDLRLVVRLRGDLPRVGGELMVMDVGERSYTTAPGDPVQLLVLDGDRVVGLGATSGPTGSYEPFGGGGGALAEGELTTCLGANPGSLPDGEYQVLGLTTATGGDGRTVVVVGEPLPATVTGGRLTTPGFGARVAELEAAVGEVARYDCDRPIPAEASGGLDVAVTATGTPGPGREIAVSTTLTADAALTTTQVPARLQVLADGIPVATAVVPLGGGDLEPGRSVTAGWLAPVGWCLSGADRLADGEYRTRLIARLPTEAGVVDVVATGWVTVADGELTSAGTVDGPVVRHPAGDGSGGMDAQIRGRLTLDGECLAVVLDQVAYPVVWPAGTTWDAEGSAVVLPGGVRLAIGSEVDGGGGYLDLAAVRDTLGEQAADLVGRCLDNAYGEVAFVTNQPDAIGPG